MIQLLAETGDQLAGSEGEQAQGTSTAIDQTESAPDRDTPSEEGDGGESPWTAATFVEDSPLGLDQVFGILKNGRRRHVLEYLQQTTLPGSLSELAERIAAVENEKERRQITSTERKRVYVALYQCHLPKLDEMDVITYDKSRGTIETGRNFDAVISYLGWATGENETRLSRIADRLLAPLGRFWGADEPSDTEEIDKLR